MYQLEERLSGVVKVPGLKCSLGEVFSLKFLLMRNETKGKEQHDQQLEYFLGLWPMDADKKAFSSSC